LATDHIIFVFLVVPSQLSHFSQIADFYKSLSNLDSNRKSREQKDPKSEIHPTTSDGFSGKGSCAVKVQIMRKKGDFVVKTSLFNCIFFAPILV